MPLSLHCPAKRCHVLAALPKQAAAVPWQLGVSDSHSLMPACCTAMLLGSDCAWEPATATNGKQLLAAHHSRSVTVCCAASTSTQAYR